MNLLTTFLETAARQPNTVAVIDKHGESISYRALADRSAHLAAMWRRKGIRKTDRIMLALPVSIDLYVAIAALWRLGATIVFPEPAMGLAGLRNAVRLTRPHATVTTGWYNCLPYLVPELWRVAHKLRMPSSVVDTGDVEILEDVEADHPALISFTSGSTGLPKGIVRSHKFLDAQNACVRQMLSPDGRHTIDLVAFPVFVIANLGIGATSVLPTWNLSRHADASPQAIAKLIKTHGVTRALVPPSICEVLVHSNETINLQTIFTGGGPIFPDLMHALRDTFPETEVMAVYGSTEAEPISHIRISEISPQDYDAMRSGRGLLAGAPVPETQLKIINDEIVVTGEHVNKGYLEGEGDAENKVTIEEKIWHRTGDAGALDDTGRLWLRGRWEAKANGRFPFELEVAARLWPGVRSVALLPDSSPLCLAIEGNEEQRPLWDKLSVELGIERLLMVSQIPLDKRHGSKVDYTALRRLAAHQ